MENEPENGRSLLQEKSFSQLVKEVEDLRTLREKYAKKTPAERKSAADYQYHADVAGFYFDSELISQGQPAFMKAFWPAGVLSLAIDPLYAPALLTVGGLEYNCGRIDEAMELFFTLLTIPIEVEEDLHEVVDKAGDFLLDQEDLPNALKLYVAAEKKFPGESRYPIGTGYCLEKDGKLEEGIKKYRRAVALSPDNYEHLNDLGYALTELGAFDEAEDLLNRSITLAPEEYQFAWNNLEYLYECKEAAEAD